MLWLLLLLCAATGGMTVFLFRKTIRSTRESTELRRLREAHEQLDHQAKLIIRTDLELHRAQAELDRRLASLMSLHQLARRLQVSLRPEEVYRQLEPRVVADFGFTKALLGMSLAFDQLEWASRIGLDADHGERIKAHLLQQDLLRRVLTNPAPRTLTAVSAADDAERALLDLLGTSTVVLAGVIPSPGPAGCLLLARDAGGAMNPRAEEELVGLLTNALVAAIENSALYEESWASQRQLEQKVQERTQELARANAELMRLNKAKSDFVSAVSHELRTPLAAIKGYAALLATGQFGSMVAPQTERLTKIQKHVDTLTQLINDLLDIARIEAGRVLMEPRAIQAEEFLASAQDFVRPQLDAKHLRFTLDLDGVSHLMGDPQHLQRVFVNLLSNAIKYTPEGGTIRVGLRREGQEVIVTVSDTGCGIPPQDLPKLFQEFVRSSDPINRQVPGTGLGLALVKRIVEAHQGRVAIASEPGHGTTVTVRLPLVQLEPPDAAR